MLEIIHNLKIIIVKNLSPKQKYKKDSPLMKQITLKKDYGLTQFFLKTFNSKLFQLHMTSPRMIFSLNNMVINI